MHKVSFSATSSMTPMNQLAYRLAKAETTSGSRARKSSRKLLAHQERDKKATLIKTLEAQNERKKKQFSNENNDAFMVIRPEHMEDLSTSAGLSKLHSQYRSDSAKNEGRSVKGKPSDQMVRKQLNFNFRPSKQDYEKLKSNFDVVFEPDVNIYNSGQSMLGKSGSTKAIGFDHELDVD